VVAAALGFLLLLPLQTGAVLKQGRSLNQAQASRIQRAEDRLKVLRQAVAGAASNAELNQQLQKLSGPVLGPADIAQPLPLLKAQVGAVLDQAALGISRERESSRPRTPLLLLPDLLRNALASLALALGFAALARRPGSPITLLQELQSVWRRSRFGSSSRRVSGSGDYLRELGRGDRKSSKQGLRRAHNATQPSPSKRITSRSIVTQGGPWAQWRSPSGWTAKPSTASRSSWPRLARTAVR
jgi:hypothetical protein